jgi:DNA topoisomerase-1
MKNLVIVESPAKARTISRMLGEEYFVTASMGHVRDLPANSLGVNIADGFKPSYQISKKSVISALKTHAKGVKHIFLAPDPDREGEAIAWHLQETLKDSTKADFKRVVFHEITKSAIAKAFEHPGSIDINLVDAQQARRILDRIVGFKISEMLWSKIAKGLSAGRVQSVALRIVCDREKEITAFIPKEYWNLTADISPDKKDWTFKGKLSSLDGEKVDVTSAEEAGKMEDAVLKNKSCSVDSVETKRKLKYSPPPFITSSLQQSAAQSLRLSASQTMRIAQQLYEGIEAGGEGAAGLITYMRTDSVSVAKEALFSCRDFIKAEFGAGFLPEKPNFFKSRESAQEAHEAIRPTNVSRKPEDLRNFLSYEQFKLYSLIWKRFIASQMKPAEYDVISVSTMVKGADDRKYEFRTSVSSLVFQGFLKAYDDKEEEDDDESEKDSDLIDAEKLLSLKAGSAAIIRNFEKEQKFTEPPPRFSEAALIKELESNGIGRPSTYATIMNTIMSRKYVIRAKGRLIPTELGFKVNDFLVETLSELFQIGFTAEMENDLDKIEEGKLQWKKMLSDFYAKFAIWVKDAKSIGAPEKADSTDLIKALDGIAEWNPPRKIGRRTYDDKKFFESVKKQFGENGIISEKQWHALKSVAVKYKPQIANFADIDARFKLADSASGKSSGGTARDPEAAAKTAAVVKEIIAVLPKEKDSGKGKYDDSKFLKSFLIRLEDGIPLSPKQSAALRKIAMKHEANLTDFDKISEVLAINEDGHKEEIFLSDADNKKIADIIDAFKNMEKWDEASRRKNDKSFFSSLSRQFAVKKTLSPKQFAALEKMAGKYFKTVGSDSEDGAVVKKN